MQCTVLYYTALYCIVLYWIVLYCTIQFTYLDSGYGPLLHLFYLYSDKSWFFPFSFFTHGPRRWNRGSTDGLFLLLFLLLLLLLLLLLHTTNFWGALDCNMHSCYVTRGVGKNFQWRPASNARCMIVGPAPNQLSHWEHSERMKEFVPPGWPLIGDMWHDSWDDPLCCHKPIHASLQPI